MQQTKSKERRRAAVSPSKRMCTRCHHTRENGTVVKNVETGCSVE